MLNLSGLTFDNACRRLEEEGYARIAEGDWAYVYATPAASQVIRITPYDPAYLLFVYTCWNCPHINLPVHSALMRLAGSGYAVEMPRYTPGDVTRRADFIASLQAAMDGHESSHELAALAQTLKRGLALGQQSVPYFGGIDWNLDNVLLDGLTPKVVDGFMQNGSAINDGIDCGAALTLTPTEIADFLQIPYYRRGRKSVGE
jgi:hypothetical protein